MSRSPISTNESRVSPSAVSSGATDGSPSPRTHTDRWLVCFFFQAEDGIRDHCVTGVQTCALPIAAKKPSSSAITFASGSGRKTRRFDDVMAELDGFFAAHREVGTWPGGVHIEFTGEDVTECLGGSEAVLEDQLDHRYETLCDPRLNARQALDLAFRVAELMRG